jgi:hypothetical protein
MTFSNVRGASLAALVAVAIGSVGCSSSSGSQPEPVLSGVYQSATPGAFAWIVFPDATHFLYGAGPKCAGTACGQHSGTFVYDAASHTLTLTDAVSDHTTSVGIDDVVIAGASAAPQSLRTLGESLTTGGSDLASGQAAQLLVGQFDAQEDGDGGAASQQMQTASLGPGQEWFDCGGGSNLVVGPLGGTSSSPNGAVAIIQNPSGGGHCASIGQANIG